MNLRQLTTRVITICLICTTVATVSAIWSTAAVYTLKVRMDEQGKAVRAIGNRTPVIQVRPDVHVEVRPGLEGWSAK